MKYESHKRNSSVELFRIIATFLVLIVHFNGWFVGGMPEKLVIFSLFRVSQAFIEALSCICVNCVLVITGWYGLKFKWKHVWTIWSVLVFIYVPAYIWQVYLEGNFSIVTLAMKFFALGQESYYVQCYLMLMFLSPILNVFIRSVNKKILPYSIAFWGIEIVFDWLLHNQYLGFGYGYMLTHFIFLYILGQTARLFKNDILSFVTTKLLLLTYLIGIIVLVAENIVISSDKVFAYSNPVNIIMTFSLFLLFERKFFYNNFVNQIGKSTLAVYIIHITYPLIVILQQIDSKILEEYPYWQYICIISVVIIAVFSAGIIYDRLRILVMNPIGDKVCSWMSSKVLKYSI